MKSRIREFKRLAPTAVAALAIIFSCIATAHAASPLDSELSAARIVRSADGREVQQPGAKVNPGDTVQYSARYRNSGKTALSQVSATLPIPAGTQFVSAGPALGRSQGGPAPSGGSERSELGGNVTRPDGALASVDGVRFEPTPLTRRVRKADGQWETVAVPLSEYRAVRWPARTLSAGEAFDVSLRVQVIDGASSSNQKVTP